MSNKNGKLIIVSGPSGVGKGTVVSALLDSNKSIVLSISATTRAPRTGEVNGVSYYFVSRDEFESMIEKDELLEHATYNTNMYGTPKNAVVERLAQGYDVLLEIEVVGAANVKRKMPDAIMVFIAPPNLSVLEQRLRGRGTETDAVIQERLNVAKSELALMRSYDYIIENDTVANAVNGINTIIAAEKLKTASNTEFIEAIESEILKGAK